MRRFFLGKSSRYFKITGKKFTFAKAFFKYKKNVYLTNLKTPTLYSVLQTHGIPISQVWEPAEIEYLDKTLEAKVKKYLPGFKGFNTKALTVIFDVPNSKTGETGWSQMLIVKAQRPLGQRELVQQLFDECPKGSYGHFAGIILRIVKPIVGDFASDGIHLFFADIIDEISQPYNPELNKGISTKETQRRDSSEDPLAREAGGLLGQNGRAWPVDVVARLYAWWNGTSYREFLKRDKAEDQDSKITEDMLEVIKKLDKGVTEVAEQGQTIEESAPDPDRGPRGSLRDPHWFP